MKRFIVRTKSIILVGALLLSTLFIGSASASQLAMPEGKGDISGDGVVDYVDYIIIHDVMLGVATFEDSNAIEQADVNDDGTINSYDFEYFPKPVQALVGDVNNDGVFNSIDLASFRLYLLGGEVSVMPDPLKRYIWDVNGDGKINSIDFALIRKYMLGMIVELPIQRYMSNPIVNPRGPRLD
jgi:hypothetical protein